MIKMYDENKFRHNLLFNSNVLFEIKPMESQKYAEI